MLRISRQQPASDQVTLVVEGRLVGEWIRELDRVVAEARSAARVVVVDLGGVIFADREGGALLAGLVRAGVQISGTSPFLQTFLASLAGVER